MIKRVLVGVADQKYSLSAAKHAVELAKPTDAKLTAISILDKEALCNVGPVPVGGGGVARDLRAHRIHEAERVVASAIDCFGRLCDDAKLPWTTSKFEGDPISSFVNVSRYHDLMVVGLHHLFEHGITRDPPNALVKLVSSGVYPMLAVAKEYRPISRVLIGYSGSIESAHTLRSFARHLPLWPKCDVKVVAFGNSSTEADQRLTAARSYLSDHGCEAEIEFIQSSDTDTLLKAGNDWDANLIVIGNSAKNLLRRRIFGETALRTIREATIPLFLAQ